MNQPQPGTPEFTPMTDRLRELEPSLAYELCVSVIDTDLTSAESEDDEGGEWIDEQSDARTDELIPDVMEYLELRGLIERHETKKNLFRVRDESEAALPEEATQQEFLAGEFTEFLNKIFDGDPPPPNSHQYIQLQFAFYGGALLSQGRQVVPELVMFYERVTSGPGLTVKEDQPCRS